MNFFNSLLEVVPKHYTLAGMKRSLFAPILLILTIVPGQTTARQVACPGFVEEGSSPTEVDRFYIERATKIVRSAMMSDSATVGALVSPTARFETWRGDYSTGGRQIGVAGVIEWAKDLKAFRFESLIVQPGPISIRALRCEHTVTVLFRTQEPAAAVSATFKFVDGLLVQASGQQVLLIEGGVR